MILIADSGSTKTEWVLLDNKTQRKRFKANGINPVIQQPEDISLEIEQHVHPQLTQYPITAVYFYGAGCIPDKIPAVEQILKHHFPDATISIKSDMVGAAIALFGNKSGIACILGTGSNSCQWDGESIQKNISPLGYILGDEGSGAVIGKRFIADVLKNQLPKELADKFMQEYELTPAEVINKVYRQSFPNRFLASLTHFISKNIEVKELNELVVDSFVQYFRRNILQYSYQTLPIGVIGSIGYYFEWQLRQAASMVNLQIYKIEQSPMEGLIEYHSKA